MSYIDSSSLLKLLWTEPESAAVRQAVVHETQVTVSDLTELEVKAQLRARHLAGSVSASRYAAHRSRLASLKALEPFAFRRVGASVFSRAIAQHVVTREHCRTLDRLHLAAMDVLAIRRLITNDARQASTARAAGFDVVVPGT